MNPAWALQRKAHASPNSSGRPRRPAAIDDFITKGVSAIVLNPCDSNSIGPAIKKANDAGIPVFTNDIKYDGDVGKVVTHIATDNYQGGKLAGEAMVKLLGDSGGKVAILHFPQAESCQLRVKGYQEVVDAHNDEIRDDSISTTFLKHQRHIATEHRGQATVLARLANSDLIAADSDSENSSFGRIQLRFFQASL